VCLLLLSCGGGPDLPLVVAANRDEFRARPAAPAAFWEDAPDVLAGRDLAARGTWLGASRSGRFAAVTNVREGGAAKNGTRSRGLLVSEFLKGSADAKSYLAGVAAEAGLYDGFNLVAGEPGAVFWLSNRARSTDPVRIASGVHGISNALLDTPWPKLTAARRRVEEILVEGGADVAARLFDVLADDARFEDAHLPETGVGVERERVLSSAFIDTPDYGTRTSTVLLLHGDGRVEFEERTHEAGRPNAAARRFAFATRPS